MVNLVIYGFTAYLTVPVYFKSPDNLHKVYRKTLDANMLPLIKRNFGKYILNNVKIALPFWMISLLISHRNTKRNSSIQGFKAFLKNILYLLVMGGKRSII